MWHPKGISREYEEFITCNIELHMSKYIDLTHFIFQIINYKLVQSWATLGTGPLSRYVGDVWKVRSFHPLNEKVHQLWVALLSEEACGSLHHFRLLKIYYLFHPSWHNWSQVAAKNILWQQPHEFKVLVNSFKTSTLGIWWYSYVHN